MSEYDVAISFAGEDRAFAERLADSLANDFGLSVFYDDYEQAKLWGSFLTEKLLDIYRDKSESRCGVRPNNHINLDSRAADLLEAW